MARDGDAFLKRRAVPASAALAAGVETKTTEK
jgi:hypothetical protein